MSQLCNEGSLTAAARDDFPNIGLPVGDPAKPCSAMPVPVEAPQGLDTDADSESEPHHVASTEDERHALWLAAVLHGTAQSGWMQLSLPLHALHPSFCPGLEFDMFAEGRAVKMETVGGIIIESKPENATAGGLIIESKPGTAMVAEDSAWARSWRSSRLHDASCPAWQASSAAKAAAVSPKSSSEAESRQSHCAKQTA
eukprot:CAMPEP_0183412324 /NCGR_PEP_ID=MMETSP0370-20130417/20937_1 /TAXON_ID=268820 /ORGANISM="Peridinium aciculiferum, Strain PAER-2" /LENGTH=198 /DNA_ID=CAMNT_0025595411 /DNA_START=368 /DNA_END=963 /DNA_ORIENTATION=-